jgi:2-beta-glucuronyltransferase
MNGSTCPKGGLLVISGHDFRSPRKAGIHFITREAKKSFDNISFFSIGFSNLSILKGDARVSLAQQSNTWEMYEGVNCYLWKTLLHPVNRTLPFLKGATSATYRLYSHLPNAELDAAANGASTIVFEAGLAPIFVERIRKLAPKAKFIYIASDLLETIGVHQYVIDAHDMALEEFDLIRIASRKMEKRYARVAQKTKYIPHGQDLGQRDATKPSPYHDAPNIVSVGSMLFDPTYFAIVAPSFPEVNFHVIGAGGPVPQMPNISDYGELPFADTLPFIKFAQAGVAPYHGSQQNAYLADSSLKLQQYAHFKLPSICPAFAVGDHPNRHGYDPDDPATMISATRRALGAPTSPWGQAPIGWDEVARLIFRPVDMSER